MEGMFKGEQDPLFLKVHHRKGQFKTTILKGHQGPLDASIL